MTRILIPLMAFPLVLAACASTPDPEPEPERVVIAPEPVETCKSIDALTRVVIPAKTKVVYSTTVIENHPYEPIEREEKNIVEVSPEIVYYVDATGAQVTDICKAELAASGGH